MSSLVISPGEPLQIFDHMTPRHLAERWLEVYAKGAEGQNTRRYMWHTFSANIYPSISGQEAINAYQLQVANTYILLGNDRTEAISTLTRPEHCSLSDYYVFPENLAWTFAVTHEEGWLGPYFARHIDYARLNQINVRNFKAYINKQQQLALARSKGWV
jgi:hypothetical protein